MKTTKEQQLAIDQEGSNIIVSAGAGSGKTEVLSQRVLRKIKDGIDIDHLLVLTFTNKAADEMKMRIRKKLIDDHYLRQLDLLDSSFIMTFDSFTLYLVKKYAYLLNISSNLHIADSNLITMYKYDALDKIMSSMYGTIEFDQLISEFCTKNDHQLRQEIIHLSSKIDLEVSPEEFYQTYFEKYTSIEFLDRMYFKYLKIIFKQIDEIKMTYDTLTQYLSTKDKVKLDNYFQVLFNDQEYDRLVCFKELKFPKTIITSQDGLNIKKMILKQITELKKYLRFKDKSSLYDCVKKTYPNIKIILDIIKRLNQEVDTYKKENGLYEFNDIAHMAIKIVLDNPQIKKEIQEYFNEIMIDEYQDTSSIEEALITLISHNNVYMVGDIKQSIYRFRNANPYLFEDKYNRYLKNEGGIKIDLLQNFRSRLEVIQGINEIFNLIMDENIGNANYLKEHQLVYGNTLYDNEKIINSSNLEIYNYHQDTEYYDYEKELFIVSEDILKKIQDKYQVLDKQTQKLRDLKYSDICIITDRNKYLDQYKKILEYHHLPSVIHKDQELAVGDIFLVLKNLISLVYHVQNNLYDEEFKYLFVSVSRSFIENYDDQKIYHLVKNGLIKEDPIIKKCLLIDINEPLVSIINQIIDEFQTYNQLTHLYSLEDNLVRIDNLIDIASNLGDLGYSLKDFIDYLDQTLERGLMIKYQVNSLQEDAINIMNIHKTKGLEFNLCYYVGLCNKFFLKEISEKILKSDQAGIIIPYFDNQQQDTFLKDIYCYDFYQAEISEKIRLFYVALTRAREKIIIVAPLDEDSFKYQTLVPDSVRLKWRRFLDIIDSLPLEKYVTTKRGHYTHRYNEVFLKDISQLKQDKVIIKRKVNLEYQKVIPKSFCREDLTLRTKDIQKGIDEGIKIHEMLEYADFNSLDNHIINKLFEYMPKDYLHIYREYAFTYQEEENTYNGVIDLMLEYTDYINIVDYKLKNIDDMSYLKQLKGYQKYIEKITHKPVFIYLYSITDQVIQELSKEGKV